MKWVLYKIMTNKWRRKLNCLIGEEFKEKVIPHAVDFFTGKALEYEDYEEGSDFDEVRNRLVKKFDFYAVVCRMTILVMKMRMRMMTMMTMMKK